MGDWAVGFDEAEVALQLIEVVLGQADPDRLD